MNPETPNSPIPIPTIGPPQRQEWRPTGEDRRLGPRPPWGRREFIVMGFTDFNVNVNSQFNVY